MEWSGHRVMGRCSAESYGGRFAGRARDRSPPPTQMDKALIWNLSRSEAQLRPTCCSAFRPLAHGCTAAAPEITRITIRGRLA